MDRGSRRAGWWKVLVSVCWVLLLPTVHSNPSSQCLLAAMADPPSVSQYTVQTSSYGGYKGILGRPHSRRSVETWAAVQIAEKCNRMITVRPSDTDTAASSSHSLRMKRDANNCPTQPTCAMNETFRPLDGTCNNVVSDGLWGSAGTHQLRFLNASYQDGNGKPRVEASTGGELPSARKISRKYFGRGNVPEDRASAFVMTLGQFLDHDIVATPGPDADMVGDCCTGANKDDTDLCLHDNLEPNDVKQMACVQCFPLTRTLKASLLADCPNVITPRVPLNENTAYVDASQVYSSDMDETKMLRTMSGGKMSTSGGGSSGQELMPQDLNSCAESCKCDDSMKKCFKAGDFRANAIATLTTFHTFWIRVHNWVADNIAKSLSSAGDEELFQEARRVTVALWQQLIYGEYLKKVLGENSWRHYGLDTSEEYSYDQSLNPGIHVEFSQAFRFGHSQIPAELDLVTPPSSPAGSRSAYTTERRVLADLYERPSYLYNGDTSMDGVDRMILNHLFTPAQKVDPIFTFTASEDMFKQFDKDKDAGMSLNAKKSEIMKSGIDVAATNVLRGRDVGLQPYNEWRMKCGLQPVCSWDDLPNDVDSRFSMLKDIYSSVDDVDLYVGMLSETYGDGPNDPLVGSTFQCIIGNQFRRLKFGDRFFYQNTDSCKNKGAFTDAALEQLAKLTPAALTCHNSAIQEIPMDLLSPVTDSTKLELCAVIRASSNIDWDAVVEREMCTSGKRSPQKRGAAPPASGNFVPLLNMSPTC